MKNNEEKNKGDIKMTKQELTERAKDEARKIWGGFTPALEEAISKGLEDGDVIDLGQGQGAHLRAIIGDGVVEMRHGDAVTARMPLTELTQEQRDRMLILKAVHAGRINYSIGRP
jgi:hypothetical protein